GGHERTCEDSLLLLVIKLSQRAAAQRGEFGANLCEALEMLEHVVLDSRSARLREGVALVAGEAARKVAAVVGVWAAGHGEFVAVVEERRAARRQQESLGKF